MKSNNVDSKTKNWYYDKYIMANVQRNILFLLAVFLSIGIFISLILVKYVYENKSVEPYLIKVDSKTGQATIIDSESKRKYTAVEAIRESFIVKYVKTREGYNRANESDDMNVMRIMTAKDAYIYYTENPKFYAKNDLRDSERDVNIRVFIRSIVFTSPKSAEVKITRNYETDSALIRKKFFRVRVYFDFYDLELPLEDRYLNPLGFQVASYEIAEEKVGDGMDLDKEPGQDKTKQDRLNSMG